MRSALVFFSLFILSTPLFAGGSADLRKGNNAYDKEKYGEAFEYYNKASSEGEPEKGIYNSGAALYRLQDYEGALQAYEALEGSGDFAQDSYYNAANAYYNSGNSEKALKSLRQALLLKRDDKEALHNMQFILKEQQNKKNQQDKNNNQGDNKKPDNQDKNGDQDKSGNQGKDNKDNQDSGADSEQQQQKLSPSEAENILKMSKEHVNTDKKDRSGLASNTVEKDW